MLLKLIFRVLFIIRMNINKKKHCIKIFYDVCMNICSVTSCEDKKIYIKNTFWALFFQVRVYSSLDEAFRTCTQLCVLKCVTQPHVTFSEAADRSPRPTWSHFLEKSRCSREQEGKVAASATLNLIRTSCLMCTSPKCTFSFQAAT